MKSTSIEIQPLPELQHKILDQLSKDAYARSFKKQGIDLSAKQLAKKYGCCERTMYSLLDWLRLTKLMTEMRIGLKVHKFIDPKAREYLKNPNLFLEDCNQICRQICRESCRLLSREPPYEKKKQEKEYIDIESDADSSEILMGSIKTNPKAIKISSLARKNIWTNNPEQITPENKDRWIQILEKTRSRSDNLCSVLNMIDLEARYAFCDLPENLANDVIMRLRNLVDTRHVIPRNPSRFVMAQIRDVKKANLAEIAKCAQNASKEEIEASQDLEKIQDETYLSRPCYQSSQEPKESNSITAQLIEFFSICVEKAKSGWRFFMEGEDLYCQSPRSQFKINKNQEGLDHLKKLCVAHGYI